MIPIVHQKILIGLKLIRHGYRSVADASETTVVKILRLVLALDCPYFLSIFVSVIVLLKKSTNIHIFIDTETIKNNLILEENKKEIKEDSIRVDWKRRNMV